MRSSNVVSPVYAQIALDIALRITRGELKENNKVYGRSVMSSEYGVSPETVRRALRLLEDMDIVEVKQNSGAVITSAENARKYIERLGEQNQVRTIQKRMEELVGQQEQIGRQIVETSRTIVQLNERIARTNPFLNYEVSVPPDSPVLGCTLAELKFWQKTGATVIAIRRGDQLILSPGPYAVIAERDAIIYVGDLPCVEAVSRMVQG